MSASGPSRRRRSLSEKMRAAFLALGLSAILLTGWLAFSVATDALEAATFERLTAARETKKRQIEWYLRDAAAETAALASDESAADALLGFESAWGNPEQLRAVEEIYHRGLAGYQEPFGFADLLLISAETGRAVYSAVGGRELGSIVTAEEYRDSSLALAFDMASRAAPGETVTADYGPHPGSGPAAFVAAPVFAGEELLGVLAIRLADEKIAEVMTGGGSWIDEGLGLSGETYLVGADDLMRSQSRFESEPSVMRRRAATAATRAAFLGETGTQRIIDYRDVAVLSAYAPLDLPGLNWVLVAELDENEAFEPVRRLRNSLGVLALVVAGGFLLAGTWFARRTAEPLLELTDTVERVGRKGLDAPVDLDRFSESDDEVARLAATFEQLRERLRATLVSRDRLDDLLASMINAVLVIGRWGDALGVIEVANPAACRLLGYREGDLVGRPAREVMGSGSAQPPWLDRLRVGESVGAIEKELIAADGRRIPVLFTAAPLRGEEAGQIVCVAQDVTEWKRTADALERSRAELEVLARRLMTAQEEERARLARELHDDLTQRLAVLAIDVGKLARRDDFPPEAQERLGELKERAITLSQDAQSLSRRLHPSILEDLGLAAALKAECERAAERLGIPVSCAVEEPGEALSADKTLALYRIAQESLNNLRHAQATEADVELSVINGAVRLTIEDNGVGFDLGEARGRQGLGLIGMDERARLVGGRLTVRSGGRGTRITAEAPVEVSV